MEDSGIRDAIPGARRQSVSIAKVVATPAAEELGSSALEERETLGVEKGYP